MHPNTLLFKYWGKAKPKTESPSWHPLAYHSLDVAASGKIFLQQHDRLRVGLTNYLGLRDDQLFLCWMTFFLALHDLGKFSEGFQIQLPELFAELHGSPTNRSRFVRHDSLGFLFWEKLFKDMMQKEDWLHCHTDQRTLRSFYRALSPWVSAMTGHHGKPPSQKSDWLLHHYFSDTDQEAALVFCREARELLLPDEAQATFPPVREFSRRSKHASWWLAGIAVMADWVGSNPIPSGMRFALHE